MWFLHSVVFSFSFSILLLFVQNPTNIFQTWAELCGPESCSYVQSTINKVHLFDSLIHCETFFCSALWLFWRDCPIWWQCVINYIDDALVTGFSHVSTFQRDSEIMFPMLFELVRVIAHSFALSFVLFFFFLFSISRSLFFEVL